MTLVSIILGGAVFAYTTVYAIRSMLPILRYKKSAAAGSILLVPGVVSSKVNEENKAVNGRLVNISYPVYSFTVGEEKKSYQSPIKYRDVLIGNNVQISYDERTKEAWMGESIPLMKRQIITRVLIIAVILAALVLEEIIL